MPNAIGIAADELVGFSQLFPEALFWQVSVEVAEELVVVEESRLVRDGVACWVISRT